MKVCCELGKSWELMTSVELLACHHDHCKGPVELEDYLLETCGTFDTNDCISHEDLRHLFNKSGSWEEWIASQIEQEGIVKYISWYAKMFERGAICEGLQEAHNEMFKGFGEEK